MLGVTIDRLNVGDYAKFRGHRIQEHLVRMWWKVTAVEDGRVVLVNRDGNTARVRRDQRYQHCHAVKWQPGDDRRDD